MDYNSFGSLYFFFPFLNKERKINQAALLFAKKENNSSLKMLSQTDWKSSSSASYLYFLLTKDVDSLKYSVQYRPHQFVYVNLLIQHTLSLPPQVFLNATPTFSLFLKDQAIKSSYQKDLKNQQLSLFYIWASRSILETKEINFALADILARSYHAYFHTKRLLLQILREDPLEDSYWRQYGNTLKYCHDSYGELSCQVIRHRLSPDSFPQKLSIIQSLKRLQYWDEAEFRLKEEITNGSSLAEVYFALGSLYQEKKDSIQAEKYYQEAVKKFPDNPLVYYELGNYFYTNGDYKKSLLQHTKAIVMTDEKKVSPWWYYRKGLDFYQLQDFVGAVKAFQKANQIQSNQYFSYWIGRSYQENQEYSLAIENYSEHLKEYPNNTTTLWHRANCYFETKQTSLALSDIDSLLTLEPNNKKWLDQRKIWVETNSK